jgi:hypothetical protein
MCGVCDMCNGACVEFLASSTDTFETIPVIRLGKTLTVFGLVKNPSNLPSRENPNRFPSCENPTVMCGVCDMCNGACVEFLASSADTLEYFLHATAHTYCS